MINSGLKLYLAAEPEDRETIHWILSEGHTHIAADKNGDVFTYRNPKGSGGCIQHCGGYLPSPDGDVCTHVGWLSDYEAKGWRNLCFEIDEDFKNYADEKRSGNQPDGWRYYESIESGNKYRINGDSVEMWRHHSHWGPSYLSRGHLTLMIKVGLAVLCVKPDCVNPACDHEASEPLPPHGERICNKCCEVLK